MGPALDRISPKAIFCGRIARLYRALGRSGACWYAFSRLFGFAPDNRLARVMCDRCEKLDVEIVQLERQAKGAGPDMLPAIELMIAVRQAKRKTIQCREER